MAGDLQQTLLRISRKAESLTERYNALYQAKKEADETIAGLEKKIAGQEEEIRILKSRVEYLTVVTTAIPDRRDVELSRARISELVREIDKCITELSE
ncbi:MAG: hypothetical protein J6B03_06690 [Candidatus Homeothermus sp.]|nr:hypothetical protein [Candidatus Homeothermus sp.]PWL61632.1 MAG: hypothetical protein DBY35_04790 [Bacteroidales bacterium]